MKGGLQDGCPMELGRVSYGTLWNYGTRMGREVIHDR